MTMTAFPKQYTKEEFLFFLKKNKVSDDIINKFVQLPETIKRNGNVFNLQINSIWHSNEKTYYEFEINYYSDSLIEYLFSSKVFRDVEHSINNLLCEINSVNCRERKNGK